MNNRASIAIICGMILLTHRAFPLGTAIICNGHLDDSGPAANGFYDFSFTLFDASINGNAVGTPIVNKMVGVTNGLFSVSLDFGAGVFTGADRWLEIAATTNSAVDNFTTLAPRQMLAPTAYALYAPNAGVAVTASGVAANSLSDAALQAGTITANKLATGQVVKSLNGLTDAVTLLAGANITLLNGSNSVQISATGGGGGWGLTGNAGTTPGANYLGTSDNKALQLKVNGAEALRLEPTTDTPNVVGGFSGNSVQAGLLGVTIGGGGTVINNQPNIATNNAYYATIAGGYHNTVLNYGGAILGGSVNAVNGSFGAIGAGQFNNASGGYSWVSAGLSNNAIGYTAAIGGGLTNTAAGTGATVPGGTGNSASGENSFAAGNQANAIYNGSFVLADDTSIRLNATETNSFLARFTGGYVLMTSQLSGGVDAGFNGVCLYPGGGSWVNCSDRNAKENFVGVNSRKVLEEVSRMPVTTWNYKAQAKSIRHIGPMAQDFAAAFAVGEDDKHITTSDEEGVALAAIQGLNQKLEEQLDAKEARIAALEKSVAELKSLVSRLAGQPTAEVK